jgi:hydrogenase/urease accessory protein HupE
MLGAVVQELGGWWSGVLHPFDSNHLVLMLIVGVLAGIATTQGREPWVGPFAYLVGTFVGIVAAAAGLEMPFLDGAIIAGLVIGVVLMFTPPPRISAALPLVAVLGGALHGLSYRHDETSGASTEPVRYVLGFVFTTVLLQAFGAITGSSIGRSVVARRTVAVCAAAATVVVLAV